MKKVFKLLIMLLIVNNIYSQVEIYPQVFASFGGSAEISGNNVVMWTGGETFYETLETENSALTQGFNQITYLTTDITENNLSGYNINLFPNPTDGLIYIQFIDNNKIDYNLQITDLSGKILLSEKY